MSYNAAAAFFRTAKKKNKKYLFFKIFLLTNDKTYAILKAQNTRKETVTMKKDRSALVSLVTVGALSAVLLLLAVFGPMLTSAFIERFDRPESVYLPIVVTFYAILPFAAGVLLCLWKLLGNILADAVFIEQNVRLLRSISFLLFFATAVFAVAGYFYMPFYLLAVCAAFMALIVRVVKNCFAAAVVLKEENDMTI